MTTSINNSEIRDQRQSLLNPEEIEELTEELDELERFNAGLMFPEEKRRFLAKLCADEEKLRIVSDMFDLGLLHYAPVSPPPASTSTIWIMILSFMKRLSIPTTSLWNELQRNLKRQSTLITSALLRNPRILKRLAPLATSVCVLCVSGLLYFATIIPRKNIERAAAIDDNLPVRISSAPKKAPDDVVGVDVKEKEDAPNGGDLQTDAESDANPEIVFEGDDPPDDMPRNTDDGFKMRSIWSKPTDWKRKTADWKPFVSSTSTEKTSDAQPSTEEWAPTDVSSYETSTLPPSIASLSASSLTRKLRELDVPPIQYEANDDVVNVPQMSLRHSRLSLIFLKLLIYHKISGVCEMWDWLPHSLKDGLVEKTCPKLPTREGERYGAEQTLRETLEK